MKMSMPRLRKPINRNTPAHVVSINGADYYFSYETCIAFSGRCKDGNYRTLRIENHWGPTTGRHFNEMGLSDFKIVEDDVFHEMIG
jgi:hypothetical protein